MKTKIIPFDLEIAKRIQAGEIEGRIVTKDNNSVRILDFELKGSFNIVYAELEEPNNESVYICNETTKKLFIELPEETPKTQADLCEEWRLEEQKHKPYIKQLLKLKDYTKQLMEVNQGVINNLDNLVQDLKRICEPSEQKYEFKPFDKVLVTQNGWHYWIPSLYRNETPDGKHICIDDLEYDCCIPYEGNEHLVGTTDKPKEE